MIKNVQVKGKKWFNDIDDNVQNRQTAKTQGENQSFQLQDVLPFCFYHLNINVSTVSLYRSEQS